MPKIKYENGVKVKTYGDKFPLIFIGEGPYTFKIDSENETKVYMFQTEDELDEFAQRMQKLYPNKKIKQK